MTHQEKLQAFHAQWHAKHNPEKPKRVPKKKQLSARQLLELAKYD